MANSNELNTGKLSAAVNAKRGGVGLRDTAKAIGDVSPATLSRIEQGKSPDLETFLRLCRWLGKEPSEFTAGPLGKANLSGTSTPELIEGHLRADRSLSPATAKTLIEMIRLAYRKDQGR
jgi:transcriptional regulator with XRE-family HTH domain